MSVVSALRVMFLDMPHSPANIIILRVLYLVVVRIFRNILTYRVCGPAFPLHLRARKLSPFSFVELGLFCSEVALQQYRTTECTSCWILRIKCSGLVLCVCVCVCVFFFLRCLLLSVDVVLCVSLELCRLDVVLHYYAGVDASRLRFMGGG